MHSQMKYYLILPAIVFANFFLFPQPVIAQQPYFTVKGKVMDKTSNESLAGASVFAENTTFGVATDAEGNFTIKLPTGGYSLVVTVTG